MGGEAYGNLVGGFFYPQFAFAYSRKLRVQSTALAEAELQRNV
jgi:hypothetical protein